MKKALENKKGKRREREKIEMVKCRVTGIEAEYVVMRPMRSDLGIKGSITFAVKRDEIKDVIKTKDEVVALNVHKLTLGWRAKKVLVPTT